MSGSNDVNYGATTLSRESFLEEAEAIADQLRARRVYTKKGNFNWLGPIGYGTSIHPLHRNRLGAHLYNGVTGVALFFAALARIKSSDEWRRLSLDTVAPLRRQLVDLMATPDGGTRINMPIGGLIGLGSLIYGFLNIGKLLDESQLISEAHNLTNLITRRRIARDEMFRIQTGSAGAVLALLALHQRISETNINGKTPLDIAVACGQHLVEKSRSYDGLPKAWPLSPGKPPLGGFCYGAAGISYALLKLFEKCSKSEFLTAAKEGVSFLRRLYSPEHGNWRDFRLVFQKQYRLESGIWKDWWASGTPEQLVPTDPPTESYAEGTNTSSDRFLDIWCHGAAGIVLGKIGALHIDDNPETQEEIRQVLMRLQFLAQSAESSQILSNETYPDDICCGFMGIAQVLNYAHQKLQQESLRIAAQRFASHVSFRAKTKGRYTISAARGTDLFSPSLFQGVAGVGYTFLHLAAPHVVPCLLLLE